MAPLNLGLLLLVVAAPVAAQSAQSRSWSAEDSTSVMRAAGDHYRSVVRDSLDHDYNIGLRLVLQPTAHAGPRNVWEIRIEARENWPGSDHLVQTFGVASGITDFRTLEQARGCFPDGRCPSLPAEVVVLQVSVPRFIRADAAEMDVTIFTSAGPDRYPWVRTEVIQLVLGSGGGWVVVDRQMRFVT